MTRILLIDDEEQIRSTIGALLRASGYEVSTAADGRAGVSLFEREPHDLVITDVLMPVMGGADVIATLRRLRPELRIIATYGGGLVSGTESVATAQSLGADRLLVKPFTLAELKVAIAAALGTPGGEPPAHDAPPTPGAQ
ncbi:MAG TPA: response regulator [Opitutaceae bacterium]|nr:response regulator [Opitutaceae bacterium]